MGYRRIGLFGGTFDPIHIGHLVAAQNALVQCRLDVVFFEVAPNPWQKVTLRSISDAEVRFQAVKAATAEVDNFVASRREIDRGGLTYTVDTLRELHEEYADAELFLIGGSDVINALDGWKEPEVVSSLAQVIWVNRPGVEAFEPSPRWRVISVYMPPLELSSSELRSRIGLGQPVDFLVPQASLNIIRSAGLYARDSVPQRKAL